MAKFAGYAVVTARMVQGDLKIETINFRDLSSARTRFVADKNIPQTVCVDLVDRNDDIVMEWAVS